ncbi:Zinc finger C2H2 type domain-containing protein [Penicillium ucsense]|uniref:Zinc finger C2H2 type domain-containing protein n=1 Tax=Penicillium ucsense TaxID=2839758 RepID=A0A8J8VX14_9EURO|nr:Zinc finger C2H2 type domain-containing protein [Penicillium ucsense]KAF7732251.1 Zinc finger C2H2 type domain-containing protein [Penicillium ucsense]
MGDGSDYPSPRSEAPHGVAVASALASATESLSSIARMNEQASVLGYATLNGAVDTTTTPQPRLAEQRLSQPRLSVRRARDPPKNAEGQIYCDHADCQAAPPTFRRPCEWNKHMDKHDRPYKCFEPGCDKIQGFTYSGGLLRHQREVHKKNNDSKKPLMCPYADCNRSTGNGFTRQENLREHLRRRHMHTDDGSTASILVDMPWERANELEGVRANSLPATGIKRRHDSPLGDLPSHEDTGDDLHNEVKRLRREVQEKDRRLEQLERIVADLQQAIPQTHVPEHDPQLTQAMPPPPPQTAIHQV